jgi:general secretion pathway protein G
MQRRIRNRTRSGITLIEMLVVITIIALFAAVVATRVIGFGDKARVTSARVQINNFMDGLGQYKLETGVYPSTEMGLQALRVRPPNVPQWNGPYLAKDVPLDPWQRPYLYRYPSEQGDEPETICLGADGQPGGEGYNADIISWKN